MMCTVRTVELRCAIRRPREAPERSFPVNYQSAAGYLSAGPARCIQTACRSCLYLERSLATVSTELIVTAIMLLSVVLMLVQNPTQVP
jgi:hypothetical protein